MTLYGDIESRLGGGATMVEGWEDGSLSDSVWSTDDSSAFNVQSSTVAQGSNALEAVSGNANVDGLFASTSDVDNAPSRGDTHRMYFRRDGTTDSELLRVHWAGQASSLTYYPESYCFDFREDRYRMFYVDSSGNFNSLGSENVSISAGQWYYTDIDFGDSSSDTIAADLYNADDDTQLGSGISGTDTSLDSGNLQIVALADQTDTIWHDHWEIL